MHDIVRRYSESGWQAFDESLEDFEARSFAYTYELVGQFIKKGLLELDTATDFLQYLVVADWNAFEPMANHIMKKYGDKFSEWRNFQWLAERTMERMQKRQEDSKLQASTVEPVSVKISNPDH